VNIPAAIHVACTIVQRGGSATCSALETALMRDVVLTVALPDGTALFQIDQVRAAGATSMLEVRLRLAGERLVVQRVRRGDVDVERDNEFAGGAEIISVAAVERASSSVILSAQMQPPGSTPTITAGDIASVEVVMRVPVQPTPGGWSYRGQAMKGGRSFVFHGPDYEVSGTVLAIATK
jgi:hypothetical protein